VIQRCQVLGENTSFIEFSLVVLIGTWQPCLINVDNPEPAAANAVKIDDQEENDFENL